MRFEFATAGRILFGPGTISDLPGIAAGYGKRVLLVTGRSAARCSEIVTKLEASGLSYTLFPVGGEPSVEMVREGAGLLRQSGSELVIAIGGGSVIDAGKAIATIGTNPGDVLDYLEVVGQGKPLTNTPLPYIAVPTTAGTGSEVTRNAVLGSRQHGVKASLRSPLLLPRVAIVDPRLTLDLPPAITARTGLDALTQLIEPYVSIRANAMTDPFCREGLRLVARSLLRAFQDGRNAEARTDMSLASLYGGLALANAGLGVVHGFAAPIGGMFDAPHGAVCAALLPSGMLANLQALRARAPESEALHRYDEVARIVTGHPEATANDGVFWIKTLISQCAIPPLGAYDIRQEHVGDLVSKAEQASSMKANPITLTTAELTDVLQAAL